MLLHCLPGSHDVAENRTACCPSGSVTVIGVAFCMVELEHLGRAATMQVPAIVKGQKKTCMKYNRLYANPACEISTAKTLATDIAMCIQKGLHDDLTLSHRHRFF